MRYAPSSEERILFIVFAVLGGIYYIFVLGTSQGDVFVAITRFMMAILVGYVAMIAFNTTITSYLANTIAKLKIQQAKAIVKEVCGKELSDSEVAELIARWSRKQRSRKQREEKQRGEQAGS